jgi:hypothetical protein
VSGAGGGAAGSAGRGGGAVQRLQHARDLLERLARMMRDNEVRSWIDIIEGLAAAAVPSDDEASAAATLQELDRRYRALSAHRDGFDELYLARPDWDEQRRATLELDQLRRELAATLAG